MRQWWTNRTIAEYINRTECFIKQYNSYYIQEIDDYVTFPSVDCSIYMFANETNDYFFFSIFFSD